MKKSIVVRILNLFHLFKRILYLPVRWAGLNCRTIFGLRCHKEKNIIAFSLLLVVASLFGCVAEEKQNSSTDTQVSTAITANSERETESSSFDHTETTVLYELSQKDTVSYTSSGMVTDDRQTDLMGETVAEEPEQTYISEEIELPDDIW